MRLRIQKWGNSLALRIPKPFADDVQVKQGTIVDFRIEDGAIVVRPYARNRFTLAGLLAGIRKGRFHGEIDTGRPCGREVW